MSKPIVLSSVLSSQDSEDERRGVEKSREKVGARVVGVVSLALDSLQQNSHVRKRSLVLPVRNYSPSLTIFESNKSLAIV